MGVREIRRAVRGLIRTRRYTVATVLTLALIIGASTLFFAVADSLWLRPLPYPEPDELLFVGQEDGGHAAVTSAYALQELDQGVTSAEGVTWFNSYVTTLTGAGDPVRLGLTRVSADYFEVVGVRPALGRGFRPSEVGPGAPAVAVVSHALWRSRFRSDPTLVGRTVLLDGSPYQVVGVMPPAFQGPDGLLRGAGSTPIDVWIPYPRDPVSDGVGYRTVRGVVRLAGDTSLRRFREEAQTVAAAVHAVDPGSFPERGFGIAPLKEVVVGPEARRVLALLALAVGLVFLVGCANVANLAVTRSLAREHVRAVRIALGARRGHLATHVGAEVLVIGVLAGLAGLTMAVGGLRVFLAYAPALPLLTRAQVDGRVVAVAVGLSLTAALLGALAPALRVASRPPGRVLGQARGSTSRAWSRTRHAFAGFQVTAAVALLTGAALAHGSLRALLSVDRGFDARGVWVAQVDLLAERYPDAGARLRFTREAARTLAARAGIRNVAFVTSAPQVGMNNFATRIEVEGWQGTDPADHPGAFFRAITPGYLEAMGIRIVQGRDLDARDVTEGKVAGALVNREFARRYLGERAPLGRSLTVFGQKGIPVVGVVNDVRYGSFAAPPVPEVYLPFAGRFTTVFMVARASGPPAEVTAALRKGVHALDPSVPMEHIPTMSSLVARSVESQRFLRFLVATLAALVLMLAVVGTYAVLAEGVARRTRELGIRIALGARRASLVRSVLAQGGRIVAGGMAVGLVVARVAAGHLDGLLFGVRASDPGAYAVGALVVAVVAVTAVWVPALRATRADPLTALKEE